MAEERSLNLGRTSKRDAISYGVTCETLPEAGFTKVADLSMAAPSRTWTTFRDKSSYVTDELPEPEVDYIQTKTVNWKSQFHFHLVLHS